ncbi:MAG: putative glycoside hydrolase [Treponema sp.]|nr:putative glycoside hydrolase [Treponema sp.]
MRLLVGSDTGLFSLELRAGRQEKARSLWSGGTVRKIVPLGGDLDGSGSTGTWAILSGEGIFVSNDLQNWENRSQGLPVKTIKVFQNEKKSFFPMAQEIKDLEINPADPNIMVCATKDQVYLSRNQGRSWSGLGAPPYRTNGIKAVAAAYLPAAGSASGGAGALTVFLSHSTYGLFYIQPDMAGAQWAELSRGLEKLETTDNADEVSDIAVIPGSGADGAEICVSQTFRRRLYRLDWKLKTFDLLWSDKAPFGTTDSLDAGKTGLRFLREGMVAEIDYAPPGGGEGSGPRIRERPDLVELVRAVQESINEQPNCVVIREAPNSEPVILSELWLLGENEPGNLRPPGGLIPAAPGSTALPPANAAGKEGLYLPVNHAMDSYSLRPYLNVINERGLDMIVIDMKDDYGRLRFTPNNPAISAKGRVFRPLDIDAFLRDMKGRGIYTIARIVVFKDPVLAAKENGKYAVWDGKNNKFWAGYYDSRRKKSDISGEDRKNDLITILPAGDPDYEIVRTFYDERWVDPYSEEVWEYTAAIALELTGRGFDEIQFDYIRFPTDGVNLSDARYRWQENGMDMESAILSFLRHIRSRVSAPVSIDIYGANGWYRTGARTGQEVELLAPWVDVICPMYYPSHFEQDFLAQDPPELRPYRIYYQGTLRTARIGRGRIIVRPYVQAFYLNVSYDRKYYDPEYVRREMEGVRDAGRPGLTYWNNSGRYDDIPVP